LQPPPLEATTTVTVLIRVSPPTPATADQQIQPLPVQISDVMDFHINSTTWARWSLARAGVHGGILKMVVPAGMSMAELKRKVERQTGIAAGWQRLVFAGRQLPDSETTGEAIGFRGLSGQRVTLLIIAPPSSDDEGLTFASSRGRHQAARGWQRA
jgi:hypothetical protein